jgi:hypothetical protein
VVLDLASWEIVDRFHEGLWDIITSAGVHCLSGNEDEWLALAQHLQVIPQPHEGSSHTINNGSSVICPSCLELCCQPEASLIARILQ